MQALAAAGGRVPLTQRTVFAPTDDAWRALFAEIGGAEACWSGGVLYLRTLLAIITAAAAPASAPAVSSPDHQSFQCRDHDDGDRGLSR